MEQKDIFNSIRNVTEKLSTTDVNIPSICEKTIDRAEIKEAVKLFRSVVFANYFVQAVCTAILTDTGEAAANTLFNVGQFPNNGTQLLFARI